MKNHHIPSFYSFARSLFLGLLLLPAFLFLNGCASTGTSSTGADMVTDSDEPESRKRARIRLELAVGYYNNGQTAVALDELKQSIAADPTMFEAYNLRGLIYMRLNDNTVAEDSFKRAISINPGAASVQHNLGWLFCQRGRYAEAAQQFQNALANSMYGDRAKTWMALGLCQAKNGQLADAESSLSRSYEMDAGNPITGYNLATLLYNRQDYVRAQFYVRRINNSELANAESLWLGVKVERQLNSRDGMTQLGMQLVKRFPQARESALYERGAFDE
jgi:type IV pilus assembly protein PilF